MRYGVCASYNDLAALPNIPCNYLEENVQRFLIPEQPDEDFAVHLRTARHFPVSIEAANSLLPGSLPIIATATRPVDTARLERYIRTALYRAEQVGIRVIVFGSGVARMCPDDYNQIEAMQQIGEHLAQWNI